MIVGEWRRNPFVSYAEKLAEGYERIIRMVFIYKI